MRSVLYSRIVSVQCEQESWKSCERISSKFTVAAKYNDEGSSISCDVLYYRRCAARQRWCNTYRQYWWRLDHKIRRRVLGSGSQIGYRPAYEGGWKTAWQCPRCRRSSVIVCVRKQWRNYATRTPWGRPNATPSKYFPARNTGLCNFLLFG